MIMAERMEIVYDRDYVDSKILIRRYCSTFLKFELYMIMVERKDIVYDRDCSDSICNTGT